jgi:hypothetical protein
MENANDKHDLTKFSHRQGTVIGCKMMVTNGCHLPALLFSSFSLSSSSSPAPREHARAQCDPPSLWILTFVWSSRSFIMTVHGSTHHRRAAKALVRRKPAIVELDERFSPTAIFPGMTETETPDSLTDLRTLYSTIYQFLRAYSSFVP